jgi:7-cyano-7-deazaguanine synthase in queuosine biosynthesis
MQQPDYTYTFDDMSDRFSQVQCLNHRTQELQTAYALVDDQQLTLKRQRLLLAQLADCVDLAVAVAVADRLSIRKADRPCRIHISLPTRHPEVFGRPHLLKQLQNMLYWYTHDHWSFAFPARSRYGRFAERQPSLFPPFPDQPIEVALWSGGLDSLAGVYHNLKLTSSTHYVLLGTGANTIIHNTQQRVARLVEDLFPGRTTLVQLPYQLDGTKDQQKHSLQRARGFVFLLLGAVCASLEGQQTLSVYENGIGAINLPFCDAEVGLDHSLSVHPVSLLRMGELVTCVLGTPFAFRNPLLFQTKAQMCEALATSSAFSRLVSSTFTCDRPHREHPMQCGYCSSCLLRRQALAALDVEDPTPYTATTEPLDGRGHRPSDGDYLRAMLFQVASLRQCLATTAPWEHLSERYLSLLEIVDEMNGWEGMPRLAIIEHLVQLYERYVLEWESERVRMAVNRGLF